MLADPLLAEEVVELAGRLASESADPEMKELAVRVAEAQVDVQRVRAVRHALLTRPAIAADEIRQLCTLSRYEKLAMRRRKFAIRAWQAALFHNIWGAA